MKPIYTRNPFVDRFLAFIKIMKDIYFTKRQIVQVKSKIVIVKAVFVVN